MTALNFRLEIHFESRDHATLLIDHSSDNEADQIFAELNLAALFALRMMHSLGKCESTTVLADALIAMPDALRHIADGHWDGGVTIAPHQGRKSQKRFVAIFEFNDAVKYTFDMKVEGFGWFAYGVPQYGPSAILQSLRFLAQRRCENRLYVLRLALVMANVGCYGRDGTIGLTNQNALAAETVQQVYAATQPFSEPE